MTFSRKNLVVFVALFLLGSLSSVIKADAQTRRTPVRPVARPTPTPQVATPAERALWDDVTKRNTKDSYSFYLSEYPQGAFAKEALNRIAKIREVEEQFQWDVAIASTDKSATEKYLADYPNGRFVKQARVRLEQFAKVEEESMWKDVDARKIAQGFIDYLDKYPEGTFSAIARFRLKELGVEAPLKLRSGMERKNSLGIEFVWVPEGSFLMGTPGEEPGDEGPRRLVNIKTGFWMGKFEITQAQWESVMGENPSVFETCGKDCPIESISWEIAQEFVQKLNEREDGFRYSLPTEAEWEYAARAGTDSKYSFGEEITGSLANFDNRKSDAEKAGPVKVGKYPPNSWGLHDMHGNVWEWVQDLYSDDYKDLPTDGSANEIIKSSGSSTYRAVRGGGWSSTSDRLRSSNRGRFNQWNYSDRIGLRISARPSK